MNSFLEEIFSLVNMAHCKLFFASFSIPSLGIHHRIYTSTHVLHNQMLLLAMRSPVFDVFAVFYGVSCDLLCLLCFSVFFHDSLFLLCILCCVVFPAICYIIMGFLRYAVFLVIYCALQCSAVFIVFCCIFCILCFAVFIVFL